MKDIIVPRAYVRLNQRRKIYELLSYYFAVRRKRMRRLLEREKRELA